MKRKRVGNASTKYCLEPDRFDSDIQNKREVYQQFKDDLKAVIYSDYRYSGDNGLMSYSAKRKALIEVHKEFLEVTGVNE